jgi:hypothetical protein
MHALNRLRVYLLVLHKGWQWKDPAPQWGCACEWQPATTCCGCYTVHILVSGDVTAAGLGL